MRLNRMVARRHRITWHAWALRHTTRNNGGSGHRWVQRMRAAGSSMSMALRDGQVLAFIRKRAVASGVERCVGGEMLTTLTWRTSLLRDGDTVRIEMIVSCRCFK